MMLLIDEYPNESPPLSREALTSSSGTVLRVRRDLQCDRPFGQLVLRTAPGDRMALFRKRLIYAPNLDKVPEAGTIVPC